MVRVGFLLIILTAVACASAGCPPIPPMYSDQPCYIFPFLKDLLHNHFHMAELSSPDDTLAGLTGWLAAIFSDTSEAFIKVYLLDREYGIIHAYGHYLVSVNSLQTIVE